MCLFQLWRIIFLLADKTEDLSPGDSISDSSERHLLRGKGGARVNRGLFNKDQVVGTSKECCCGGGCSVTKSCPTLCEPMDCNTPGFPVLQYLPEFAQIHIHWICDAIQPSHLLSPSSSYFNLSQHQGLFQWVGSSHQVAKILELQHQKNIVQ